MSENFNYKGYSIEILNDDSPENPREAWDNLGKIVCFHKRCNLGDKTNFKYEDFDNFKELEKHLIQEENAIIIFPIYMYDHSGITIDIKPFSCSWDSGQIGFIYATKEMILKEFGGKRVSAKMKKETEKVLISEVKTYDDYLTGNVYGYKIKDRNGEEIDSCWGYYGEDGLEYMKKETMEIVDYRLKEKIKKHIEIVKSYIKKGININYRKALEV